MAASSSATLLAPIYPERFRIIKEVEDNYRDHLLHPDRPPRGNIWIELLHIEDPVQFRQEWIVPARKANLLKSRTDPQLLTSRGTLPDKILPELQRTTLIFRDIYLHTLPLHLRDHIVLAGGAVLDLLLGKYPSQIADWDLFLIGRPARPLQFLQELIQFIHSQIPVKRATRTQHSITLVLKSGEKVQVILRSYTDLKEVLVGFDLDASGMALLPGANPKGEFWLTSRAFHAVTTMCLHVDLSRASTTYGQRLIKYARKKWFSIWIPFAPQLEHYRKMMEPQLYYPGEFHKDVRLEGLEDSLVGLLIRHSGLKVCRRETYNTSDYHLVSTYSGAGDATIEDRKQNELYRLKQVYKAAVRQALKEEDEEEGDLVEILDKLRNKYLHDREAVEGDEDGDEDEEDEGQVHQGGIHFHYDERKDREAAKVIGYTIQPYTMPLDTICIIPASLIGQLPAETLDKMTIPLAAEFLTENPGRQWSSSFHPLDLTWEHWLRTDNTVGAIPTDKVEN